MLRIKHSFMKCVIALMDNKEGALAAEDEVLAKDEAMSLQLPLVLLHSTTKANRVIIKLRIRGAREAREMDVASVVALMAHRIGADS